MTESNEVLLSNTQVVAIREHVQKRIDGAGDISVRTGDDRTIIALCDEVVRLRDSLEFIIRCAGVIPYATQLLNIKRLCQRFLNGLIPVLQYQQPPNTVIGQVERKMPANMANARAEVLDGEFEINPTTGLCNYCACDVISDPPCLNEQCPRFTSSEVSDAD